MISATNRFVMSEKKVGLYSNFSVTIFNPLGFSIHGIGIY